MGDHVTLPPVSYCVCFSWSSQLDALLTSSPSAGPLSSNCDVTEAAGGCKMIYCISLSPSPSHFSLPLSLSLCVLLTDSFMDSELGPNANPGIHIGAVFSKLLPSEDGHGWGGFSGGEMWGQKGELLFLPVCVCVLFPQSHTHMHTFAFNSTCRCYSEKQTAPVLLSRSGWKCRFAREHPGETHKCFSS